VPMIVARQMDGRDFADMIVDNFDEMLEQAKEQPLVMGIALHPYIVGQPYRLRHLRRALQHISKEKQVWLTTPGRICDFVAAGTHKWMFAPRGTGIIWALEKNWGLLRPTIPSFYSPEPFTAWEDGQPPKTPTRASWISPGGFKAYEHQWAMAEAFDFHRRIGRKRIAERIAALNTLCKDGLARIPKVKVLTPRDPSLSAGIICFDVEGQTPNETVRKLLERKVIASTSPYKVSHARLAPSLVNDEGEVEAALRAVRDIA